MHKMPKKHNEKLTIDIMKFKTPAKREKEVITKKRNLPPIQIR